MSDNTGAKKTPKRGRPSKKDLDDRIEVKQMQLRLTAAEIKQMTSEREKKLVWDTIIYKMTEQESMTYLHNMNQEMAPAKYYRLKKDVQSDPETKKWLADYISFGFVKSHREDVERIQRLIEPLVRMFVGETSKADYITDPADTREVPEDQRKKIMNPSKNKYLILRLSSRIEELTKTLSVLNFGTPIIAAIHAKISGKLSV